MQSSIIRCLKRGLIYLGFLLCLYNLCLSHAFADTEVGDSSDYESLEIKLIQPYESKYFGSLTLPAFWEVSEDANLASLHAVEQVHPQKLSLHLFLIDKLPPLGSTKLMQNVAIALQNSLVDGTIVEEKSIKANKKILMDHHYIHTQGWEGDVERSCISLVFLQETKLLSLNICGPTSRGFVSAGGSLLSDIFIHMH